jgi:HTH-type transcriptional regulator/antitoxin HigA
MNKISPIRSEAEYEAALQRSYQLMDAEAGTDAADELEVLSILIEAYEERRFPIKSPHPIEAIRFRMEELDMRTTDLGKVIGHRGRASEILNGKRKLTLDMIRNIHRALNIPTDNLIGEY